ncbi:hypothetical protein [Kordia sp.]|uniref:hypothetical protein n=1 Tax=Kordia sp. TaxID=1965332 RepID=UPI003D2C4887
MRVYKILLIFFLILFILCTFIGMYEIYEEERGHPAFVFLIAFVALGILLNLLSLGYQIKSFRYYRKSKPYKKENKISLILRFSSVACGIYYILFAGVLLLGMMDESTHVNTFMLLTFAVIFMFGVFTILEALIMRKRIKQQQKEQEAKFNIETIGN